MTAFDGLRTTDDPGLSLDRLRLTGAVTEPSRVRDVVAREAMWLAAIVTAAILLGNLAATLLLNEQLLRSWGIE